MVEVRSEVEYDEAGTPLSARGTIQDVTDRRGLERQLAEKQRLGALGRVAGGVAHAFNNLLQAVLGSLNIAEKEVVGSERAKWLRLAEQRIVSGQELTERLLAWDVGMQSTEFVVEPASELISESVDLVSPLLGERINVKTELDPGLWSIKTDRGQFQSAMINLATNARDAMGGRGDVTIKASNTSLGAFPATRPDPRHADDYVRVSVTDTGAGMSAEVKGNAFNPFFTTKEIGQGAGLGLSAVFGFVTRSSGGHVDIAGSSGFRVAISTPRGGQAWVAVASHHARP